MRPGGSQHGVGRGSEGQAGKRSPQFTVKQPLRSKEKVKRKGRGIGKEWNGTEAEEGRHL